MLRIQLATTAQDLGVTLTLIYMPTAFHIYVSLDMNNDFSRFALTGRKNIYNIIIRPLFFYFLVYGFLGRKNGSVGREKKKKNSK